MCTDRVAGLTLAALTVVLLGGCEKTAKPAEQPAAAAPAAPEPAAPRTVHVIATDFAFQAPDTLAGGLTTFHLMNNGKELHQIVLLRLAPGQTIADIEKMNLAAPTPPELHLIGGPSPAVPGGSAEATVDLTPGQYVMLCGIPSPDGKPHLAKGMLRALTVTAPTGPVRAPVPDVTVTLTDYKFEASVPLSAGHHVIKVVNAGTQWHEMTVVRLAPGKKVQDFAKWGQKLVGPPPGTPLNGASSLSVGEANFIEVDLTPGEYGFLCFLPDVKDHKPHLLHGMIQQFTVK